VPSAVAGAIDSARVCRVDCELDWHPHGATAARSHATTKSRCRRRGRVVESSRVGRVCETHRAWPQRWWVSKTRPTLRTVRRFQKRSSQGGRAFWFIHPPSRSCLAPVERRVHSRLGRIGKGRSGPVSRVLSRAAISLGRRLPAVSSDLPGRFCEPDQLATVSRASPCVVLLRVGFAEQAGHPVCWCALTAPFHPYRDAATA
jgi:hypothetical protein